MGRGNSTAAEGVGTDSQKQLHPVAPPIYLPSLPTWRARETMDETRRTTLQAARFILVSGISLSIDYGIYSLLTEQTALGSSWAKRISFGSIFLWGFFAHKHFTFKNRGFSLNQPARFALLYATGWVLNSIVHDLTAADAKTSNPAFLTATFVWACWNFLGQKYFVFRSRDERGGSGRGGSVLATRSPKSK